MCDQDHGTHELTAVEVACTRPTQDQAGKHPSTGWERVHESLPLAKELWTVDCFWERERQVFSKVSLLVGWPCLRGCPIAKSTGTTQTRVHGLLEKEVTEMGEGRKVGWIYKELGKYDQHTWNEILNESIQIETTFYMCGTWEFIHILFHGLCHQLKWHLSM